MILETVLYGVLPIGIALVAFFYALDFHHRTFVVDKKKNNKCAALEE
jgi:hypothetical protein